MATIVIIGGGIGGLATANLLAKAGHTVHVYEKERQLGGRAGQFKKKGFTFDTGPSWYLMPEVFEHYYELLGTSTKEQLDLIKLKPAYKVFFENAAPLTITGTLAKDAALFESIEKGAGKALKTYVSAADKTYRLALKHFLYSNFTRARDLLHKDIVLRAGRMALLSAMPIHRYVKRFVKNKQLQQILEYPMVFLGSSPYNAPALYSLMSALDFKEGVFYPKGTMYAFVESLVKLGKQLGVHYHTGEEVRKILVAQGHAVGVQLASGTEVSAEYVISNSDLHHTETKLLKAPYQSYPASHWKAQEPSPSAILMYLGVKGRVPEFEHHTLLFVDDWKANFDGIYRTKTLPKKASLYISKTSHGDNTAPKGDENIFVLVPVPAGISLTQKRLESLSAHYLAQIKDFTGVDLAPRIMTKTLFGPNEFKTKYFSWQSSMLGPSHKLTQSAFFRTPNKSKKVKNLFYVGAHTVPGVGVPMCLISAELVYKRIAKDRRSGPVKGILSI